MSLVVLTITLCAAVVWMFRNRPVWVLGLIMALYVGIPGQADGLIVPFFHPGSYLTFALLAQHLVGRDRAELSTLMRPATVAIVVFLGVMSLGALDLLNPLGSDRVTVVSTLLRVFIAAFLLFPLTLIELRRRAESVRVLRGMLIGIGLVQVVIAIVQFQTDMQSFVFWRSYYDLSYWWSDSFPIPLGTTGHPLQLAAYLSMCIPLLARLRSPVVAVGVASLFLYGCALGTGRASTALAAVGLVFLLFWHGRRWVAVSAATVIGAFVGVELWRSDGLAFLREKIADDGGSARLRGQAFDWAVEHMDEYLWFGYPGGRDLRGTGILRTSLENGYLIAGLSFGLLFAAALLLLHAYVVAWPLRYGFRALPEVMATSFVWVSFFASSSFMAFAIDGRAFWVLAAMAWAVGMPDSNRGDSLVESQPDVVLDETSPPLTMPYRARAGVGDSALQ